MVKGEIIKVSGPLVVAKGMEKAKMFDVVRVGNEKLVGEIIKIENGIASIQVYEETEGLKVGDPVVSTEQPLVVELAPGLLSTIFDGVQRPLSEIEKKGDFIHRGVDVPSIDRNKKWEFNPVVKKGDKVEGGDVIGEVQETPLIVHKIMVPPGLKGEITEIKKGSFTVEEEIGKLKTENGVISLCMLQKWPVRVKRPFKKRLPPDTPLVTGQRVIDTLFPILKGGTACIPGPFGSGKCVTGDTPVFINGKLVKIEDIFSSFKNKGNWIKKENEEYIFLKEPVKLLSFYDDKLVESSSYILYKGKTSQIVKIHTLSGRTIEITPTHKLLTFTEEARVEEKEAIYLKEGDYLLSPRFLPHKGRLRKIPVWEIFGDFRICENENVKQVKNILKSMNKKYTLKEIAKTLNISYSVLCEYIYRKNLPELKFVKKLYKINRKPLPEINWIKGETNSKKVKIPHYFDENVSFLMGMLMADGMIKGRSVRFYNNEESVLSSFSDLVSHIFSVKAKKIITRTVKMLNIESSVMAEFFKSFSFPEYKKSKNLKIPSIIFKSPKKVIGNFLKGYFICDGYFSKEKGEIEITTASEEMASGLSYLLTILGVVHNFKYKFYKGSKYFRIFINGYEEIKKFYLETSGEEKFYKYRSMKEYLNEEKKRHQRCDTIQLSVKFWEKIYNRHKRPYAKLKKEGIEIFNYLNGEKITLNNFKKVSKILQDEQLISISTNCLSHFYPDRIIKKEIINKDIDVYDLQVEKYHNFVGGKVPSILHNTVVLHQIAKWADSQIVIYIGCGERGNEMADVLIEFPELKDPASGRPLVERTVLIANTSNMPVAAREASIYTGVTIGEYFRDMGYSVALMADSTSRWAEALREISGRMEEMPGEEGYPAYLGTRVAEFYERSGKIICLGKEEKEGSLSVIGAVSPPGGDLTDPVVQMTLRVVKVFWGLDDRLAYQRHFPAINWLTSYSLYNENIKEYLVKEIGSDFPEVRNEAISILEREAELLEIVRLVGMETLSDEDRLTLETARSIREDFLHQSAFDERDAYTTLKKQYLMLKTIITFHHFAFQMIKKGKPLSEILKIPVREDIVKMRYIGEDKLEEFNKIIEKINNYKKTDISQKK